MSNPLPPTAPTPNLAPPKMDHIDWWYALGSSLILLAYGAVSTVSLINDWPTKPPGEGKAYTFAYVMWWPHTLTADQGLVLIAFLAGVMGSVLHCLGALYWHCGKSDFKRYWVFFYIYCPPTAGLLAMGLFWLLSAGLFPGGTAAGSTSVYGIAATGFMAGLFSRDAINKLASIAANIFSIKPSSGSSSSSSSSTSGSGTSTGNVADPDATS